MEAIWNRGATYKFSHPLILEYCGGSIGWVAVWASGSKMQPAKLQPQSRPGCHNVCARARECLDGGGPFPATFP